MWQQATQFDAPLTSRPKANTQAKQPKRAGRMDQPVRSDIPVMKRALPPIMQGSYAGVDKNTQEKFRKGEMTLDARLDLHGDTLEMAHKKVEDFIHLHYDRGHRMLLIITGKGSLSRAGALKTALPGWLADANLRPFILAFDQARQKDGGSGAFYVLLRRRRD